MTGNKKVLITGATGFIGSHIVRQLLNSEFTIIATKRSKSNLWRCQEFSDQIIWINTNDENWKEIIYKQSPEILIHAAWEGLNTNDRNNWDLQRANFDFSVDIFNTAILAGVKKIISLGSQAEYGVFSERITEHFVSEPADSYGATKLYTCNCLRLLCQQKNVQWFWIRVFSVFGPKENETWLFPKVIKSLLEQKSIDLTKCDQLYDYIYINDFSKNLLKVFNNNNIENSGIYNFGSNSSVQLKKILLKLAEIMNVSESLLNFGAIPYRSVQSMHMEGDCTKFISTFGNILKTDFEQSLIETVGYYKLSK